MVVHELKINDCYWANIQNKRKTFEIRFNDRDYQVGDLIWFCDAKLNVLPNSEYKITYVHTGYGLQPAHVVLGIEKAG